MSNTSRTAARAALLAALAAGTLISGALTAQSPAAKTDPQIKEQLKLYVQFIKDRKGSKDTEAKEIIDKILQKFDTLHPKDKSDYAKAISQSLLSKKCKRKPEQAGIYRTTIFALGRLGKHGGRYLAKAFDNKSKFKGKKPWLNLRALMLEHLGRTKDKKYIDFLLDVALKDPNDSLMSSAGGALKHYKDMPLKVRKPMVKQLIKKFAQVYDNANTNLDSGDMTRQTWERRLAAVSDPWNTALQALTKQRIRSPNKWNNFWNKEKKSNWDKPKTRRRR